MTILAMCAFLTLGAAWAIHDERRRARLARRERWQALAAAFAALVPPLRALGDAMGKAAEAFHQPPYHREVP